MSSAEAQIIPKPSSRSLAGRLRPQISGLLAGLVVVGVLVGGGLAVLGCVHQWPARHFGVVEKGVLYRSGEPDQEAWEFLVHRYGIRTVIDLRVPDRDASWAAIEQEFCRKNDVRLVIMPVALPGLSEPDLERFVSITTDPASQPVLVHCEAGSIRTSVVVGAYRIVVQGWSYEKAMAEARRYGFRPRSYPEFDAYLRELAERPR